MFYNEVVFVAFKGGFDRGIDCPTTSQDFCLVKDLMDSFKSLLLNNSLNGPSVVC